MRARVRIPIVAITAGLVLLVAIVPPASPQQFREPWMRPGVGLVVPGSAIGPIRLGMSMQEVEQVLGKSLSGEIVSGLATAQFHQSFIEKYGTAVKRIHYWFVLEGVTKTPASDPTFFVVEDTRGKVGAVGARFHRMFRTASSIGLGSTEAEIQRVVGTPERTGNFYTGLVSWNTQSVLEARLFYLSTGIRFNILLGGSGPIDDFKGLAFEVVIFCKWKKSGSNWEFDPTCADPGER